MASEYLTEEERRRAREKTAADKLSANQRIDLTTKQKQEQDAKLRQARKEASLAKKAATDATVEANKKSATYPSVPCHFVVAPGAPIVAGAAALADGRLGSNEDVVSWSTGVVGLLGTVACILAEQPTGGLIFATIMAGGLGSVASRRGRELGARMRSDSAHRAA